jgi:hypothetical protein
MSQYADGIPDHDPAVIQNFLKLPGGLSALARGQIRLSTRVDGVESPEETRLGAARLAQFIGNGDLEKFDVAFLNGDSAGMQILQKLLGKLEPRDGHSLA